MPKNYIHVVFHGSLPLLETYIPCSIEIVFYSNRTAAMTWSRNCNVWNEKVFRNLVVFFDQLLAYENTNCINYHLFFPTVWLHVCSGTRSPHSGNCDNSIEICNFHHHETLNDKSQIAKPRSQVMNTWWNKATVEYEISSVSKVFGDINFSSSARRNEWEKLSDHPANQKIMLSIIQSCSDILAVKHAHSCQNCEVMRCLDLSRIESRKIEFCASYLILKKSKSKIFFLSSFWSFIPNCEHSNPPVIDVFFERVW